MIPTSWVWALGIFGIFLYLKRSFSRKVHPPPGPKGLPLIGNLHQFPLIDGSPHTILSGWHAKYGAIVQFKLGSRRIISLGSLEVATDLLGKRGRIYNSRPPLGAMTDIVAQKLHTALLPYGPRWQAHNRIDLSLLGPRSIPHYAEVMERECLRALHGLIHGQKYPKTFKLYSASTIWSLAYGESLEGDEEDLSELQSILEDFVLATSMGASIVDLFPILGMLPNCLAPWKQRGDKYHVRTVNLFKRKFANALETGSWNLSTHVMNMEETDLIQHELQYLVGVLLMAGIDTTSAILSTLMTVAVSYPGSVQKAQEELDRIVGGARLPCPNDLSSLPYVQAFISELLRWRPLIPEGAPHYTTEDDKYREYDIQKDIIIILNHWSIHLDEAVYRNATTFEPERFLENPNLPSSPFGIGRRACPGQNFARASLNVIIPRLLWGFNFEIRRENGTPITIDPFATKQFGALLTPKPFELIIKARSDQHALIIQHEFNTQDWDTNSVLKRIGLALGYREKGDR